MSELNFTKHVCARTSYIWNCIKRVPLLRCHKGIGGRSRSCGSVRRLIALVHHIACIFQKQRLPFASFLFFFCLRFFGVGVILFLRSVVPKLRIEVRYGSWR